MIPIAKPYIGQEEIDAVTKVMKTGNIAQGPKTRELEEKFAAYCGTKYAVAMNSGTAALHTGLYAMGASKGDEVIITPFTFISSANVILMQGATPVFVDINEDDFILNADLIEHEQNDRTKVIMPVDLYGQMADYSKIQKFANDHNLLVLEDSAQAICAEQNGRKAGSMGDIAGFSLYATKNLTSGEGGMLTTDNEEYADAAKLFRQHGRSKMSGYEYVTLGYNYRTTDICSAIMVEQLKKADEITDKRIANAGKLTDGLSKMKGIVVPSVSKGNKHTYHQYTIRVTEEFSKNRDEVVEVLKSKGIGCGIYYPKPLHLLSHYQKFGYKEGDFPVAEKVSKQVLSLPVHPHLTSEQIDEIISVFWEME